jgi:hypothetical protein
MASVRRAHAGSARASRLDLPGSISDINDYFDQQGWTDGLPIIPPTEDLVSSMLEVSPAPAEQVLARLSPRNGTVTVEKVAINAVMAGCRPAYFPVVLAAVKAVFQPQLNAGAITTTGGAAPVVIVSGPIARRLGIHSGTAVLGSGHWANVTIGRALRLTMRNLGGATADTMEKSTHGWPGKYTMCFAENAERNPWEPLHVELGFASDASIVVVVAARGLITVVESSQESGLGDLETLVSSMRSEGISGYYYQARGVTGGGLRAGARRRDRRRGVRPEGNQRLSLSPCPDAAAPTAGPRPLGRPLLAGGLGPPAGGLPGSPGHRPGDTHPGGGRRRRSAFLLVPRLVGHAAGD